MVGHWGSGQNLLSQRVPSGADRLYITNDYRKPKEEVRETKYGKTVSGVPAKRHHSDFEGSFVYSLIHSDFVGTKNISR